MLRPALLLETLDKSTCSTGCFEQPIFVSTSVMDAVRGKNECAQWTESTNATKTASPH